MKKFLSKITILILSLILSFSIIGCDGCDDSEGSGGGEPTPQGPDVSYVQPDAPSITMLKNKGLLLGESFVIVPTKKNIDGDFAWLSSNPSVASVTNGVVRASGVGTAEITASIGEVFDKCTVTVTYGDYKPELLAYGVDGDEVTLSSNSSFNLFPYVLYNGLNFSDATITYSSDTPTVATVEDGKVTAVSNGTSNVTLKAVWRDFDAKDEPLLTKTIKVIVKDDVRFMLNGGVAGGYSLETPAKFIPTSEHNNVATFTPTVSVNGEAETEVTDIELTAIGGPMGKIEEGVDYTFEKVGSSYVYTALAVGDSLVTLRHQVGNDVHVTNFYISATRPTKVFEDTIEYFNIKEGTIKVEKGGNMVSSNLVKHIWGEGVTLYDAYENAQLLTFTSNGEVLGVSVNTPNGIGSTVVKLGTKTEVYEISLRTAGHFIFDKQDVKSALEGTPNSAYTTSRGYFPLMNDVDMEGESVNAYLLDGFVGTFDGRGNSISNIVTDTTTHKVDGKDRRGGGLFALLKGSVKNVAFVNLKGVQSGNHSYVGLLAREFHVGSLENVYIDVNPETAPKGIGLFYDIGSSGAPTFKNVVVNYPGPNGYVWNEEEYKDDCNSAGYYAKRGVLGLVSISYSQDIKTQMYKVNAKVNMENLIILSPMPLYHRTPDKTPADFLTSTTYDDWFAYAENETKLWHQHPKLDEFYPNHEGEHTVQSAGEFAGKEYRVTHQKVRVLKGVRRYDNATALISDNSDEIKKVRESISDVQFFKLVDGMPVWYSLVDEYTSITANGEKIGDTLNIDCYSNAVIDVKAITESAESVTVTIVEDSDLISIDGTTIIADKVGSGATVTVNYVWGGYSYSKRLTVNVLNPFKFYANDNLIEGEGPHSIPLGEVDLKVKIGDTEVSNVTFSENVDGLSINGNVLLVEEVVENADIKANFNYRENDYELSFVINTIDPVSVATTVTVDGVDATEFAGIEISNESLIALKLEGKTATVSSISINSDKFGVNGDKVTALGYGSADMLIVFDVDGISHKKVITVKTVYDTVAVTTASDYDAATGELIATELYGKEFFSVTVNDEILTVENGGLIKKDGVYTLRAKTSASDKNPGVPFVDNTTTTPDQLMTLKIEANDAVYTLDKVVYWTALIGSAAEFKTHIEFDPGTSYSSGVYNKGLFKLSNDIDFENEDGSVVTMDYYARPISNVVYGSGQNGFAGVFDGDGYTIKNFASKEYGLFASLSSYKISGNNVVVKDFAMTNVRTSYKFSGNTTTYGSVLAYAMYNKNSVDVEVSNIYVQIDSDCHMAYGIIAIPSAQLKMNNVYVEYQKSRIEASTKYTFDADYSETDGKTYIAIDPASTNTAGLSQSATLFRSLRRVETAMDTNVTNVYIASPQPVAWQGTNSGAYFIGYWKYDTANKTHTLLNNGYNQGNNGKQEFYYGFAFNEVKSYIPVIKEMTSAFAEISVMDGYIDNKVKTGFFCSKCNKPFTTGTEGDTCSVTDCGGTLEAVESTGFWADARSYVWTFYDIGANYTNKAISTTNGIWKFTGVKKYDTVDLMANANNTYESFTGDDGNGLWKVVDGVLTWKGRTTA